MNNDDWDSVSSDTPTDSKTDDWDSVSAPQPSRNRRIILDNLVLADSIAPEEEPPAQEKAELEQKPHITPAVLPHQEKSKAFPRRQASISTPLLKKAAIFGGVVLLLLVSSFGVFQGISIHNASVSANASVTALTTHMNATATAQAVPTVTTEQQIYNQATSGTPAVDDPLSDDRNSWGVFTTSWGGQCAFTGGAYHLSLSKVGYWLVCTGGSMGVLKSSVNFALQVQISIVQGNYGGIIFGADATPGGASNAYRIDISPVGAYLLYQIKNKQSKVSQEGLDPAIKTGLNQPNVITIIVKNSNFYLYANSQFVISQKLTAYTPGEGDFEALSPDQPTDVAFSDMKIWSVP